MRRKGPLQSAVATSPRTRKTSVVWKSATFCFWKSVLLSCWVASRMSWSAPAGPYRVRSAIGKRNWVCSLRYTSREAASCTCSISRSSLSSGLWALYAGVVPGGTLMTTSVCRISTWSPLSGGVVKEGDELQRLGARVADAVDAAALGEDHLA